MLSLILHSKSMLSDGCKQSHTPKEIFGLPTIDSYHHQDIILKDGRRRGMPFIRAGYRTQVSLPARDRIPPERAIANSTLQLHNFVVHIPGARKIKYSQLPRDPGAV